MRNICFKGFHGTGFIVCRSIDCIYGYLRLTTLWSVGELGNRLSFHRLHLWLFMFDHVVVRMGIEWIHWGLYVSHIVIQV